jgi:putative nucleotidyltransferase with HDIG domain
MHSAATSLAAKAIIKEAKNRQIPQASTVAALIHDIGKLIMARYLEADASALSDLCDERNLTFVEAERELFGCDHAEVGGVMAEKWSFPEPIRQAIEQHHQTPPHDQDLMLETVMIADVIAKSVYPSGPGGDEAEVSSEVAALNHRLRLTAEGIKRVCNRTSSWLDGLKSSYGIQV